MMMNHTIDKLHDLKLEGMARALDEQLSTAASSPLSFEERVTLLVDAEATFRDNKRLQRLLATAKLRESACVEDIDYRASRKLDRSLMATLAQCTWTNHGLNVILTGPTGSGKTWLACALGNQACRHGLSVKFMRVPLLLDELAISHGDGSFRKKLMLWGKVDLLILDDLGINTLTAIGRSDLLELIEQRSGSKSTIVTSQLPLSKWHDYLSGGNPTVGDAIMDRLVNGAHRIDLAGESLRRRKAADGS